MTMRRALPRALALLVAIGPGVALADLVPVPDGTVVDTETGLVWDRCLLGVGGLDCGSGDPPLRLTWSDALQQVAQANMDGHRGFADWRLPGIAELESIVDLGRYAPAFDTTVFPEAGGADALWSATTDEASSARAWALDTLHGAWQAPMKLQDTASVRMVRGGDRFDRLRDVPGIFSDGFEPAQAAASRVRVAPR